ncbi:MAG: hypothetical protein ACOC22_04325 [bacterium]
MGIDHLQRSLDNYLYSLGNEDMPTEVALPCCGQIYDYNENPNKFFKENGFKPHVIEEFIYHCPDCGQTLYSNIYDEIEIIKV